MRSILRIAAFTSPLALALACMHSEGSRGDREYRERDERARASQSAERIVAGRLEEVTPRTITIASPDGYDRTLWIDPRTSVTIDGRTASLGDLAPGEEVRASFAVGPDGRGTALSIASGAAGQYGDRDWNRDWNRDRDRDRR